MLIERVNNPLDEVSIGVVGKYVELEDAYKSLREALIHGGLHAQPENEDPLDRSRESGSRSMARTSCRQFDGILVPGGFGKRGHSRNDSRHSIRARRESAVFRDLPRNAVRRHRVCPERLRAERTPTARSSSQNTPHPVIYKLRDLLGIDTIGGTMRLGAYPANLAAGSLANRIYRLRRDLRKTSSSLRVQSRFRGNAHRTRPDHFRRVSRTRTSSRSSNSRIIPGSSAASSIRNSNPSRSNRIRCSHRLSARPTNAKWLARRPISYAAKRK